jgi:succinate dehydrogenase/fumarate reductase flavoprotein subunit
MMEWAIEYLDKVENSRSSRIEESPKVFTEEEVGALLKEYHPDHSGKERSVRVGSSDDTQSFPLELADLLESDSPLPESHDPAKIDIETDVLVLGGGGAGTSAALTLQSSGLNVHLATKLRLGDSNTIMAEGGIQSSLGPDDSPQRHYADAYVGGHGKNDSDLLRFLCEQGPENIRWLSDKGVMLDRNPDGTFRLRAGGGTSIPRVLACRDFTGLEIMRVLKDSLLTGPTQLLQNHAAVEFLDNGKGRVTGAVLWNSQTGKLVNVSARAVILATGGSGQLHYQGFSTSNHFGATGDGLVLAYRQGARLVHMNSCQYHPSGSVFPEALVGQLVTEAIRSMGAHILNEEGQRFVDEMTYRDVVASAIIKEVAEGRGIKTPSGRGGVWLDTPLIEKLHGEGTLHRQFPGLIHRFERYEIDPAKQPILIYPTLHYQNGGVKIDTDCQTDIEGLWAAGEVTGGLHGTNRLMGNSLLDIVVFGRRAAESVMKNLQERDEVTLNQLKIFREQLAKIDERPQTHSPQIFPHSSNLKLEIVDAG